jgi:hypothetical protein
MLNIPIKVIIRLYEEQTGLKTISVMARTSRNTVKKYIRKWNSLFISYEEFQGKSDSVLYRLFCIPVPPLAYNPRLEELERLMPSIIKELGKKGMTTLKQWSRYRETHPDGYGLTRFRMAIHHYRIISNPSMRMEHKLGDKMFIDYTGDKLWIYSHGEVPRQVEVFVAILGCSLLTYVGNGFGQ